ncbi:MAG: Hsp20/alpha crystallin family protein [Deltaproteobacteria bacterium]|nr:Hsp20/alpha crystallin family protein [Deltaproteobacteria bacterium]MCW5803233.1 Hsp20/alpha crystallin family protein [Deltaproteobacteria bacterium]
MSLVLRNSNSNRDSNHVTRYRDPFSMARELLGWDPFFSGVSSRAASAFAPAFEVKETLDSYVVRADIPGVAESDLDIAVHNNVLSVSGNRASEERKDGEAYALYERQFGSFTRSFQLPELADGERIEAKLEHGVLTLTIAKKAEARPRKIALKK